MNRFEKRQQKRRQVFYASLGSHQIAELDENGQLVVTTMQGYVKKMEPVYLEKSPTFATIHKTEAGSEAEKADLRYVMESCKPRYEDKDEGVCFY